MEILFKQILNPWQIPPGLKPPVPEFLKVGN
jgi:hypothetical protein